jgi:hypothetical protein
MPRIIDHPRVLEQLQRQGLRSLYHNSGAFGLPDGVDVHVLGWIGPDDPTIRPALRPHTQQVPAPHPDNLAACAIAAWIAHLPVDALVMPMSHWAYELDHGSRTWMPQALQQIGLDPGLLTGRNDGSAICFSADDSAAFRSLLRSLLQQLVASDFMIAFPGIDILCTIHHHQQLWWQMTDASLLEKLQQIPTRSVDILS